MEKRFNIRVYGLYIDDNDRLLLADEREHGMEFTKLPGGGLEFGEGPIECILRECKEELNEEIEVLSHFYTTDFFQQSAFNSNDQLIAIYYLINIRPPYKFSIVDKRFDFMSNSNGERNFRLVSLTKLTPDDFTFPVDKKVLQLLQKTKGIKSLA
jgi:8-oxo-dGTP diphosphatase